MSKRTGKILPVTLHQLVSHPATVAYPAGDKSEFPESRGKIVFDAATCVGCTACMRDCPTGAITIEKVADKQFKAFIDMDVCIFCSQCVTGCPKKSLHYTPEFELAVLDRKSLKTEI